MDRSELHKAVTVAARHVSSLLSGKPKHAIVLGSGLGDFSKRLEIKIVIETSTIPHYPSISVASHTGQIILASFSSPVGNRDVLVFKGRTHFYESGVLENTVFQIFLMKELGIDSVLLSNAAGGINRMFVPGDLMLITDYLDLTQTRLSSLLPAVADIEIARHPYNEPVIPSELKTKIRSVATNLNIALKEGTYCWLRGPSYESAAEIQMLTRIGADAVGMSTVPEIFLGKRLGMQVAAISVISNLGTGISSEKLSHEEVSEVGRSVQGRFGTLVEEILRSCL